MSKGRIQNNFFTGIAVLLPLILTYWIVALIATKLNKTLLDPILQLVVPYIEWADREYIALGVKLFILVAIIYAIVFFGMIAKHLFIQKLITVGESLLLKVPFVNKIYSTIHQISSTFFTKQELLYNKVVIVEYPRKGIFILGLLTSACKGKIGNYLPEDCMNVFIPTTPNPTSGYLIMVPRKDLQELDITVEDAMKVIISGGVVTPEAVLDKPE